MRIEEFCSNYDLHDSLVEKVEFHNENLTFKIDLCNWRQKFYCPTDDEMKTVSIVFHNVKDYVLDATNKQFDSDTILEFLCSKVENWPGMQSVKFVIEGEDDIKIVEFKCDSVEVEKNLNLKPCKYYCVSLSFDK